MSRSARSGGRPRGRSTPGRSPSRGARSGRSSSRRGSGAGAGSGAILAGSLAVLVIVVTVIVSMSSKGEVTAGEDRSPKKKAEDPASSSMSTSTDEEATYSGPAPGEPPRELWEQAQRSWTKGERLLDQARVARDTASQEEFDRLRGEAYEQLSKATAEGQRYLQWFNLRLDFDDSDLYDPERYAPYRGEHRRTERIVQKWIKKSNEARH